MKLYALTHEDGNVSIMQLMQDHPVEHEISRCAFTSPVVEALPVTADQAAAIRAARPKPIPGRAAQVPAANVAEITIIQRENDELKRRLEAFEARFDGFFEALAKEAAARKLEAGE